MYKSTWSRNVQNRQAWNALLNEHERVMEYCIGQGEEKYVRRHVNRGMLLGILQKKKEKQHLSYLTARDRIALILDPGLAFS